MATTAMIKRRKILPSNRGGVRKTKGGARQKRAPTKTVEETTLTHKPYQWDNDDEGTTVNDRTETTVEATIDNKIDTSEDDSDNGNKEVIDESTKEKRTESAPTPPASTITVRINKKETFESLHEHIAKLQNRNTMLSRQIKDVSKMGGVDRYEVMQLGKMVKEDLFKRVKFITTMATESKCL